MADEPPKLCDVCHERPATVHICYGDNSAAGKAICRNCFDQGSLPAEMESFRRFLEIVRQGKCQYCGAPAFVGSGSLQSPLLPAGLENTIINRICEQCAKDQMEFYQLAENKRWEGFDKTDKVAWKKMTEWLQDHERRKQEFMAQKVKARGD